MKTEDFKAIQSALHNASESIMDTQRILSDYSEGKYYDQLAEAWSIIYRVQESIRLDESLKCAI